MDQYEKFYAKALNYLTFRARSEKEIRDYLKKKNAPVEVVERIINSLIEYKFINDEEFARMWVESRNRASPRAGRVLRMELKQKGIDKEIIDKLTEGKKMVSDLESAKLIVRKRLPRFKGVEKEEIYIKLGGFLARKGYSWDIIKKAIDISINQEQD